MIEHSPEHVQSLARGLAVMKAFDESQADVEIARFLSEQSDVLPAAA